LRNTFESAIHKLHTGYLPYYWIFIFPAAALLSLVLTFEKTLLAWVRGTQLLDYVLSYYLPPVAVICVISVHLCYAWLGLFCATTILTRSVPPRPDLIRIILTIIALGLERIPTVAWQAIMVPLLGEPD